MSRDQMLEDKYHELGLAHAEAMDQIADLKKELSLREGLRRSLRLAEGYNFKLGNRIGSLEQENYMLKEEIKKLNKTNYQLASRLAGLQDNISTIL